MGGGAESAQTPLLRKWGAGKVGAGSEPEDRRRCFLADAGSKRGGNGQDSCWTSGIIESHGALENGGVGGGAVHVQALCFLRPCRAGLSLLTLPPMSGTGLGWVGLSLAAVCWGLSSPGLSPLDGAQSAYFCRVQRPLELCKPQPSSWGGLCGPYMNLGGSLYPGAQCHSWLRSLSVQGLVPPPL